MGKRNLRERMASLFELPGDVMADHSRISLIGAADLVVENHRGLVEYTTDRVVLVVPEGSLAISGTDLTIGMISPEQVTIQGQVRALVYSETTGGGR